MKTHLLFTILILFAAEGGFAAPRCESVLLVGQSRQKMVDELANMQLDVVKMDDVREKNLALSEFKRKLAEVIAQWGPEIKTDMLQAFTAKQRNHQKLKASDESQRKQDRRRQEDKVLQLTRTIQHPGITRPAAWVSNEEFLANQDGELVIYNYKKKKVVRKYEATKTDESNVNYANQKLLTADGKYALLMEPFQIKRVDLSTGEVFTPELKIKSEIRSTGAKISEDGRFLFVTESEGRAMILSLPDLQLVLEDKRKGNFDFYNPIVESPDHRFVIFMRREKEVLVNLQTLKKVSLPLDPLKTLNYDKAIFSEDGKQILFVRGDGKATAFDMIAKTYTTVSAGFLPYNLGEIQVFGRWAIGARSLIKPPLHILDRRNWQEVSVPIPVQGYREIGSVVFHGRKVFIYDFIRKATGANPSDRILYVFDIDTGELTAAPYNQFLAQGLFVRDVSPDGKSWFLGGSQDEVIELY